MANIKKPVAIDTNVIPSIDESKITTPVVKVVKEAAKPKELDIDDIVAKAVAKAVQVALSKQAEKHKEELEVVKKEVITVPKKAGYKFIPSSTKVRIMTNISGRFNFTEDRGKVRVFIQMNDAGDTQLLDYDEFKVVASKNYLKSGVLAIQDVYSEEGDIDIQDVALDANVANLYKEGSICINNLDLLFSSETLQADFEKFLLDNKLVAETVLDFAYKLYRAGKLNDLSKANFLRTGFNNPNLFK